MKNVVNISNKNKLLKEMFSVFLFLCLVFSVFGQSEKDIQIPREFLTHPEHGVFKSSMEGYELIHLRDQFSKVYYNPDGSFSKTQGKDPLHYKDEQGRWLTFSNEITRNSNNSLLEIKGTDRPISINIKNGQNTLYLTKDKYIQWGNNVRVLYLDENNVVQEEILPNNDLNYSLDENKLSIPEFFNGIERVQYLDYFQIRTDFILDEKPTVPSGSKYLVIEDELNLPKGYTIDYYEGKQAKDGWYSDLEIYDEKGKPVGGFSKPVIYDSYTLYGEQNNNTLEGLYQVERNEKSYNIKILVTNQ